MTLSALIHITNSRMKAQELFLLLKDKKYLVRQGYYEYELPKIKKFCQQNSLHSVQSKFKILLDDKHNFTNRGLRISETDPRPGMHFIYISKDEKTANLALLSELQNNHLQLGQLLNYPGCCTTFFTTSFNDQHTNLEHPSTNPWTNLTKREQDICFLSHFPCSSDCPKSIFLAKLYYTTLQQENPTYAEELFNKLNMP